MAEKSKISWTDSTLNFWEGCTKVSAGCANCYAEARDKRFTGGKLWGKGAPRRKSKSAVRAALAMNRKPWICDECGKALPATMHEGRFETCMHYDQSRMHRRRIFSLSLGDWLDDEVPIEWLAEMLDTIQQCGDVTWILCTKRPENFQARFDECGATYRLHPKYQDLVKWLHDWKTGNPPNNIILLTSVENQEQADKRIPELLKIPAACRGLSLEPLLGPVNLESSLALWKPRAYVLEPRNYIDWLIIGGESGPNARPCNVDWIRSLVQQGNDSVAATFVKQLGANRENVGLTYTGKFIADKKGGDPAEWPANLQVQQWPKGF